VKAACWNGINKVSVEQVPDASIRNEQDAIVKVRLSSVCGSDLHLLGGYVPAMRSGDVIGHEFLGEVVETGRGVRKHRVGDRVVVCSVIACGRCWYCHQGLYSCCDNSNTNPAFTEVMYGHPTAGIFGYSHALGGFKGSHAEYTRVPFADYTAFAVPDGLEDLTALFASDTVPTGWMGADMGEVRPGDVVAIWGCGAVGQMAARSAELLGAERVIVIDEFDYRLGMAEKQFGVETINYRTTAVEPELRERSGGRGPDVCIDAVGLEAISPGPQFVYDKAMQTVRAVTDRAVAVRQAVHACRKGGTVFLLGVFAGLVDKFPLGAAMNKGLTLRGAQQHGERYIPMLLERMERGEIATAHLATHVMPLDDAPLGYELFREKKDDCVRAVFRPDVV
jgi:threonine dehydrogenase-like Zn-dependent dehydrogenase